MVKKKEKKKMSNIVLFDMDGTLTPPRQPMQKSISRVLLELTSHATVGIVTGSPFNYIQQQCARLFGEASQAQLKKIIIFPCNGTQVYHINNKGVWEKSYAQDMRQEIGEDDYRTLIKYLIERQYICSLHHHGDFNFVGHFISYRDSMVNWSLAGRLADEQDRLRFMEVDKSDNLRVRELRRINDHRLLEEKLCFVLGGNTSIDIYPHGWDKTHVLNHCKDFKNIWFVGDRCTGDGNDRTLYEAIRKVDTSKSFETKDTKHTATIIKTIMGKINAK